MEFMPGKFVNEIAGFSKTERAVTNPLIEIILKLANQLDVDLNDLFAN